MQEQYKQRLTSLRQQMDSQQFGISLITSPLNIFYFTGFLSEPHERFMALVIDNLQGQVYLFVPALDEEMAKRDAFVDLIIPISDEQNPYQILAQTIRGQTFTLGVEKEIMTLSRYEHISKVWPQISIQDIGAIIQTMRLKKSMAELQTVKQAIHLVEQVLAAGVAKVKIGMTELDLTAELEYQMRVLGAGPSFSTIVLAGENSALPHGRPGLRPLQQGDLLLIDLGVVVDGYCSDITRTFLVGEGAQTRTQTEIYSIVYQATLNALDAIQVGAPLSTIDKAARQHIIANGYSAYFNNRIGHGLGLDVHEAPSIHGNNQDKTEPGLLFTIEPGIYLPELGGVRIEENVYIHETGQVEVLTNYPRELTYLAG